jgi:hypothetical protein
MSDEDHERLRFAFDTATKALFSGRDGHATVPISVLTPLLDYVGFREFTFAAADRRRDRPSQDTSPSSKDET